MITYPVPESFETSCISLRTGEYHTVRVRPQRPTRSGFFNLDVEEEDGAFATLISYLFEESAKGEWGNSSEVFPVTDEVLTGVWSYFNAYDNQCHQCFVGLVGFAALVTGDFIKLPEEVEDPSAITEAHLLGWMSEYLHIGRVGDDVPVFYNPHLGSNLIFSADPKEVGVMTRVGDYVSILVHNAERSVIILRVGLTNDDSGSDTESSTEERPEPEGS